MMCGGCTSRVENVLKVGDVAVCPYCQRALTLLPFRQGVESVSKVDVSLENKSAKIELTDAASITAGQLAMLVKDLGFEVQLKSQ